MRRAEFEINYRCWLKCGGCALVILACLVIAANGHALADLDDLMDISNCPDLDLLDIGCPINCGWCQCYDDPFACPQWDLPYFPYDPPSGGNGGQPRSACGNGTVDDGEECDDGNSVHDDVCSNTCTLTVSCTITADPDGDIWWFAGADASNYSEEVTLTATVNDAPEGANTSWRFPQDKVVQISSSNTELRLSTDISDVAVDWRERDPAGSVTVEYEMDGTVICQHDFTVRAPLTLQYLAHEYEHLQMGTWVATEPYRALDQMGVQLPHSIEWNEVFTTPIEVLYPNTDWGRGPEGAATHVPWKLRDGIGPTNGIVPPFVFKEDPGADVPVVRFDGRWRLAAR